MDKKILLSGAAALLLVGNMYSTPVNASALSLSIGGETSVSATMTDKCNDANQDDDTIQTLADFVDTTYGGNDNDPATTEDLINAIMDDVNTDVVAEDDDSDLDAIHTLIMVVAMLMKITQF